MPNVDSPFHRFADGIDLAELPLDRLAEGALLVGFDSVNIDDTADAARPVHTTLLQAGVPICEHLTNVGALPTDGFRFSAVPVKVKGMGTFPVRACATLS